ncbi:MAG: tannase/feruloyl esterase family alpha/beta hydrolase [Hyphomonadaceae bacterium]|nr:tannase/feruloyl esterase family alpha/beta hydrolase [Hyphomonadaceae bacterium]
MVKSHIRTSVCVLALSMAMAGTAQAQVACESMKGFQSPDVKITAAAPATAPVPLCKVDGVIGKELNFSVWLPEAWNGKFVMGGQGGYAGRVESQAIALQALQKGYAVAGTDTGHTGPGGATDGAWALGNLERVVNYAHAGIHRVTETSKAAVKARYGRAPEKSYFAGCSNGGRAALMAAQRYPGDFDGIVAGAPALDIRGVIATFMNVTRTMYPDPARVDKAVLSNADQQALGKAVLAKCDAADGLTDGVMTDPTSCKFDIKTVACKSGNQDGCLSNAEIAAVETITKGPMLEGKPYHVGFPYGGESNPAGWGAWLVGMNNAGGPGRPSLAYGFSYDFLRYFVKQDANWSYKNFNLATFTEETKALQATLSPTDPDLSAFRAKGGKLLMYHGWSDSALSPLMSIGYADKVFAKDAKAKSDVRLFMLPGVLHCTGGPGPDRIDYLDAIDKWSSGGAAPDELTASFAAGGARKVCAYPKTQTYKGAGDGKSADQFDCK